MPTSTLMCNNALVDNLSTLPKGAAGLTEALLSLVLFERFSVPAVINEKPNQDE